jgi:hypothetical protein
VAFRDKNDVVVYLGQAAVACLINDCGHFAISAEQPPRDRPNRKPHRELKPTKGTETDLRQKLSKVVRELAV